MPTRSKAAPAKKKGFTAKTFSGMSKKRIEKRGGGNFGQRVPLKEGVTVPVQCLEGPAEATEFEVHAFQEDGQWHFVPCAGDNCPLCQSDDEKQRRTSYRFIFNVYNLEAKKVQLLEGPQQLAQAIFYRFERKPANFLKRSYDITRFPTTPTSYQFELGEDDLLSAAGVKKLKLLDHDEYLIDQMKRYYGDELPEVGASSLDDDEDDEDLDDEDLEDEETEEEDDDLEDDEDDDDEEDDEDDEDLEDEDDDEEEDDEDDDDEEDDDEDEDDEPPARGRRTASAKKAPAKKVAPKRAAAKKAPAKKTRR